ncbi:hypothetical protein GWK47_020823 [Chionoecetes opilio]|uniref:Uncharacterized protein n=1 Tax=Chionoecetes opilio TaxID=41210 RepID=A0A8J5CKP7_CHIOP|nr:hypothetical protein GWK47_020823 [Chionoecetes opilio]
MAQLWITTQTITKQSRLYGERAWWAGAGRGDELWVEQRWWVATGWCEPRDSEVIHDKHHHHQPKMSSNSESGSNAGRLQPTRVSMQVENMQWALEQRCRDNGGHQASPDFVVSKGQEGMRPQYYEVMKRCFSKGRGKIDRRERFDYVLESAIRLLQMNVRAPLLWMFNEAPERVWAPVLFPAGPAPRLAPPRRLLGALVPSL